MSSSTPGRLSSAIAQATEPNGEQASLDVEEAVDVLLRDLRTSREGLSSLEAQRRAQQYGPNELERRETVNWPKEVWKQLTGPLALLLWFAAALELVIGQTTIGVAIVLVIVINAIFALVEERQAEQSVEALSAYMPERTTAMRDAHVMTIDVAELVPGDVILVEEGERVPADIRLIEAELELDMSALTGESQPVQRCAEMVDSGVPKLEARDLAFMGSTVTEGEARGVVFATGMRTELGRIASMSQSVEEEPSPLEREVRRLCELIAVIAVAMAILFVPIAHFGAGLSLTDSVVLAVGLLAGQVPEGLMPAITLSLAVAVRSLAKQGAVVKHMSAVETLGTTDVICTDKTGTLTENRMRPVAVWTQTRVNDMTAAHDNGSDGRSDDAALPAVGRAVVACSNAHLEESGDYVGDPTEVGLMQIGRELGASVDDEERDQNRIALYHFDSGLKLMSTADQVGEERWLHTKGAPEAVLNRCETVMGADGETIPLDEDRRRSIDAQISEWSGEGMRLIAVAQRRLPDDEPPPKERDEVERQMTLLGVVSMEDPPRAEAAAAIASCHKAGIRIHVITGDHPLTAAAIARRVGVGAGGELRTVMADKIDTMPQNELTELLSGDEELVFARATPEAKLRIADTLKDLGHVVAMTGDGVNDAPALRAADIGIAMGKSGTDVARESATMVLTDDNFATIEAAIKAGRTVYDNIRKFIIYIFAHATPESVPFLVFGLSGAKVPLALPVLMLLAFDVGSETLPSLALSRDPSTPGIMKQAPRDPNEPLIQKPMLVRAWLFLGVIVSALAFVGFFYVLLDAGWHPGDPTGNGHPLHHAYLQAATMYWVGMMAGQMGTAFAVRTRRAPLKSVGAFTNHWLLKAEAGVIAFAALFMYVPPFQRLLGTAALPPRYLVILIPYPFIVLGADELRKWVVRRRAAQQEQRGSVAELPGA